MNTNSLKLHWLALAVSTCMLALVAGCGGSEARKARHVEQGEQFMAERNYAKALLEFRNALQIDPKDARVRALTGLAAERNGDFNEAIKLYRVALAADESLVLARAHLARFMALGGLPDEAMDLLKPGLEKDPSSADLLSVRAIVYSQQGDAEAARKDAEEAVRIDPKNSDAVSVLASLLWRQNHREAAVNVLTEAVAGRPEDVDLRLILAQLLLLSNRAAEAEGQLAQILRLEPGNYDNSARLIQVYVAQGKTDQAIAAARDAVKAFPDNRDTKLALAQMLVAYRSFDEAEQALAEFRKQAPKDLDLLLGMARFYEANGRYSEAENRYTAVLGSDPTRAQGLKARTRLAALKLRSGDLEAAGKLVDEVLNDSPADADALVTRAELALQRGDTSGAITDLRAALGNAPDSVPLASSLARAHVQAGEVELAEQVLRGVVQLKPGDLEARLALAQFLVDRGKVEQARPVLEQLVVEQPANVTALAGLARLQLATRDPTAALRSASTIQSLQPNSAAGYLLAGQIEEAQKRGDAARKAYELAAQVDPRAIEPLAALARLDIAAGQPERTLQLLDGRIRQSPDNALFHALRGDVLLAMKKPADAVQSFTEATKSQPRLVQGYRGLGRAYVAANQPDRAIEALQKGIEATRGSPWIALQLAEVYESRGRIDEAERVYDSMLARNPREDVAANNLAMLLVAHRTDAASLDKAGRLVERFADASNPAFLDTRGWVLYKRGQTAEAAKVLQQAVDAAPYQRVLRYHLGMAQLKAGAVDDARRNLELAVAGDSEFPEIERAREALAAM